MVSKIKFQNQNTKPGHLVGVLCITNVLIVMSSSHIITNTQQIQKDLDISEQVTSWIMNVDTIMQLFLVAFVGKFGERYGSTLIMTLGLGINALFNLCFAIPQIAHNCVLVIIFRALAAVGLGLAAPCVMPVAYQLVMTGKIQVVISIASLMVPFGAMASSFSAGFVAQNIGWQFMCVIIGVIALINFVCCVIFLPFRRTIVKSVKINTWSVLLLGFGLVSFIAGLLMVSETQSALPTYAKYILISLGFVMIVTFFVFDYYFAKSKIFSNNLMNRSIIVTESLVFLTNMAQYGERYLIPFNLAVNLHISSETIGMCMAFNSLSSLIFAPLVSVLYNRFVSKYVFIATLCCYVVVLGLNVLQLLFFPNVYLYVILNFLSMGLYISIQVVITSFIFAQCPRIYGQQIGVLNQLINSLGNSIGVTSAVVISQLIDKNSSPLSIASSDLVYLAVIIFSIILSSFLFEMLQSEKDKRGFNEESMLKANGFDDEVTQLETTQLEQLLKTNGENETEELNETELDELIK
ncbi:Major_facilitator superfamily protein [Hexamita inflata]|uniref:Major_facilitator superfamily protein n=1 Tax=Hexamita inflata TaxID=28002 RepID=A0ABP1HEH3_9EUKA